MNWICKKFDDLNPHELYAILQLRNIVFAVEQNCVYRDMDDKDQLSFHFMGWADEKLVAYTRLMAVGVYYPDHPAIGRVVTSPDIRRSGIGRELMKLSIQEAHELFNYSAIKIGAQLYLREFYESLGFRQTSDIYLEDRIEHIEMILTYQS